MNRLFAAIVCIAFLVIGSVPSFAGQPPTTTHTVSTRHHKGGKHAHSKHHKGAKHGKHAKGAKRHHHKIK